MAPFDSREMKAHATDADPWSHTWANTVNAPSFGPYCVERWVRDDEFVLRANPNYYRGKPAIERVVIKKVPQSANRVLTLRAGRADLTQRLTARDYAALRTAPGVSENRGTTHCIRTSPSSGSDTLTMVSRAMKCGSAKMSAAS